jgi:hypothetical protein
MGVEGWSLLEAFLKKNNAVFPNEIQRFAEE